jgi:hypothetical protein
MTPGNFAKIVNELFELSNRRQITYKQKLGRESYIYISNVKIRSNLELFTK